MGDSESMYENVGQKYSYIRNNTQSYQLTYVCQIFELLTISVLIT